MTNGDLHYYGFFWFGAVAAAAELTFLELHYNSSNFCFPPQTSFVVSDHHLYHSVLVFYVVKICKNPISCYDSAGFGPM